MNNATETNQEIRKRLVLNFPGFEQTDSIAQLGRLRYGAENTGKLWGYDLVQGDLRHEDGANHSVVDFSATGGNWQTHTRLVQFRWNDIVHAYEKDSFPGGFLKNLQKYFAFFLDGTVRNYRRASWRYWAFTIFPVLLFIVFAVLALAIAAGVTVFLDLTATARLPLMLVISLPIFLALCKWPGDRLYLILTVADWGFARDMVLQANEQIEARFDEFAKTVLGEINRSQYDEIVVVGHSFGSLWAVAALARAIEKDPQLLNNKSVRFLALGSSMLKIALARNAGFIRDHWRLVMDQPNLFWHEVQTKDDLIAFYPCDPFETVGIINPAAEYRINQIRFGKGMNNKRYRSMRKSFYRTHRQYILYYDKRVPFDYMIRLFGPFSLKSIAGDKKVHKRIDPAGNLL